MRRLSFFSVFLALAVLVGGANGCSSDPNVEGAKLYIQNEQYDQALENLNAALEENPDNVEALIYKGEVLRLQAEEANDPQRRLSLLQDMQSTLDRATQLAPEDENIMQSRLAGWAVAVNAGNQLLQGTSTNPESAAEIFEISTELVPDSSQGFYGLGLANIVAGDAQSAIAPLERAVDINPNDENATVYLSNAYLRTDRGSDAVALLEDARTRFPESDAIRQQLTNAYVASDQTEEALTGYEEEVQTNPDDPLVRYNYGVLLLESERYDEAIAQLERAVELEPGDVDALYNLGVAHYDKARMLQAETENIDLDDREAYEAATAEIEAELDQAIEALQNARDISTGDREVAACEALFRVYSAMNRESDAEAAAECAGISMN